jgi:hypothetical protein
MIKTARNIAQYTVSALSSFPHNSTQDIGRLYFNNTIGLRIITSIFLENSSFLKHLQHPPEDGALI